MKQLHTECNLYRSPPSVNFRCEEDLPDHNHSIKPHQKKFMIPQVLHAKNGKRTCRAYYCSGGSSVWVPPCQPILQISGKVSNYNTLICMCLNLTLQFLQSDQKTIKSVVSKIYISPVRTSVPSDVYTLDN